MKIAQVICTFPPYRGGMGNSAYNFSLYLAALNHEVDVITPLYNRSEKIITDDNHPKNLQIIRIKPHYQYGNAAVLPIGKINWNNYDIIHLHYPFYGTAGLLALKKYFGGKFKLIIHYHMDTQASGFKGKIFKLYRFLISKKVLDAADMITCASLDYVKHGDLASYYEKHSERFLQIPFGVDAQKFCPREKLITNEKNILFVGGLDEAHYFKGVDVLLKSFAIFNKKQQDYRLVIVGKGNLLDNYKSLARDLNIFDKVDFVTDADDIELSCLYRDGSFFVLPSINRNEAFGLVLLEAMSSGLPVIASNLPGVRSVFRNGEHGYLVKPGDVDDLVRKMLLITESKENLSKMSTSARSLVEERYGWEKAASKLHDIYHRVKHSPKL